MNTILDLLRGKKMLVMTDMGVEVELTIDRVVEQNHSRDLEASTAQNDWWPASQEWTSFKVYFTTGKYKEYDSIKQIKIL